MKKKYNGILIVLCSILLFTYSCKNNDGIDAFIQEQIKAENELLALFKSDSTKIKSYIDTAFNNPIMDTVSVKFQYINKTIKRGLYYEILTPAANENYEYKGQVISTSAGAYFSPIYPKVKLNYTAKLIDGTIVQSDMTLGGGTYDLNASNVNILNNTWYISFLPYIIRFNNENQRVKGLTNKGLQEGQKIRVISPSYWAFGNKTVGNIPANSILIYEFTIIEIE